MTPHKIIIGMCKGFMGVMLVVAVAMTVALPVRAMPFRPALSPTVEPLRVSLASPLQSLSQGER